MRLAFPAAVALGAFALVGCSSGDDACGDAAGCAGSGAVGTTVLTDYTREDGFFTAPFPSESRRKPGVTGKGSIDLSDYESPTSTNLVPIVLEMLEQDARGFSTTAGMFFRIDGAPQQGFELGYFDTVKDDSPVFVVAVDESSPDYLVRHPVEVQFREDGGPFGAENLLSIVPLQGMPLRPDTTYAAVIARSLLDADGRELGQSVQMRQLAAGQRPDGMSEAAFASYDAALSALEAELPRADVAGLAVFRTGEPTKDARAVFDHALARPLPELDAPLALEEEYDDFCVYRAELPMPVYQAGTPPFSDNGGNWVFDDAGEPELQGEERARIFVTIPKAPMPSDGYPIVLFSRTGGGGDRPLIDRGPRGEPGGEPLVPGTGPALHFARAGWAGASVDGPHGGIRNVTGGDEQFLTFNVNNLRALRDNVRQSAVELALQAEVLEQLTVDVSGCAGASVSGGGPARFDPGHMALMGHSMGATISPLTAAIQPRFEALLLSGAGGSWIENVVFKESPVKVKGFVEILLQIVGQYELHTHDPFLSMFQWAAESSDPPVYARDIIAEPRDGASPRHVLMMQGIVDTYILPPIANATSLSLGLDLAGAPLDEGHPDLTRFDPLEPLLALSGAETIALPASGNIEAAGTSVTALVTQHARGPIEDGHEVVFQTEAPKHQYRCFLESLLTGTPTVPGPGGATDSCN